MKELSIEEKAKAFTKAHKGESADEILAEMRGEEPVSEELWEAAQIYYEELQKEKFEGSDVIDAFKAGTLWQKEQFEKNRLKHCNSITNEQAELEQGFIDQHLDKYQRMPTFLDAIEYGMRLQKQQMMKEAILRKVKFLDSISYNHCIAHLGMSEEDTVKLIIIKED